MSLNYILHTIYYILHTIYYILYIYYILNIKLHLIYDNYLKNNCTKYSKWKKYL